jgi:hypothetical protein
LSVWLLLEAIDEEMLENTMEAKGLTFVGACEEEATAAAHVFAIVGSAFFSTLLPSPATVRLRVLLQLTMKRFLFHKVS